MLGATHSGDCKKTGHDSLEHSSAEPSGHSGIPSALIASAALALAGWAAPLRAQTAAGESPDTSALQEIVVTARKREERLIDVPVAVTAVTAATINQYQATDLGEIGNLVPGVSLERTQSGSSGATLTIRGVGNLASDYGNEQPVAVNIDGVQITKGHVADIGFFDLDSVQVLKGPQSLFFGKNSPAGVVVLNSVTPGSTLEGYMKTSYEFTAANPAVEGGISIPITGTLSIRIAARYSDQLRGYVTNYAKPTPDPFDPGNLTLPGAAYRKGPDVRNGIARFTAVWKPADNFDATFKVLWSDYRDRGSGIDGDEVFTCGTNQHPTTVNLLNPLQAYQDPHGGCTANHAVSDGAAPAQIVDHFFGAPANGEPYSHTSTILGSLYLNYTLPDVKFTSVTGVYDATQGGFDNFDDTVYAQALDSQHDRDNQISQELRAASTFSGPLNYTVGAYYEYDHHKVGDTDKIFPFGPYPIPGPYYGYWNTLAGDSDDISKNYSVFGQLSWKILDNLELAGGARYSHDDRRSVIGNTFNYFDALVPVADNPFSPAGVTYSPHIKETNTSPEVTLTYHPEHDLMVYAAYKTGYLSGGIANPANVSNYTGLANPNGPFEFGEEKVKGGEIGIKGLFLDGKFQGELTFFDYKYTGLQVETFDPDTVSYTIRNAGSSTDKGIELQGLYAFDRNWSLHGSLELIDLTFGSYTGAQCYPGQTVAQGCSGAGLANASQDLSGTRYGDSPVTGNLGVNYEHALNGTLSYKLGADAFYNSRSPLYERDPYAYTTAYTLINVSASLYPTAGPWMVHLIGTNLSNVIYYKNYLFKPLGANNDISAETIGRPRMITLEADYKF
jgi:outer membrane receptor protein involved in Fe transport